MGKIINNMPWPIKCLKVGQNFFFNFNFISLIFSKLFFYSSFFVTRRRRSAAQVQVRVQVKVKVKAQAQAEAKQTEDEYTILKR